MLANKNMFVLFTSYSICSSLPVRSIPLQHADQLAISLDILRFRLVEAGENGFHAVVHHLLALYLLVFVDGEVVVIVADFFYRNKETLLLA